MEGILCCRQNIRSNTELQAENELPRSKLRGIRQIVMPVKLVLAKAGNGHPESGTGFPLSNDKVEASFGEFTRRD
jgi:hypothetical protein